MVSAHAAQQPTARTTKPRVAVAVPSYNHKRFIEQCLRSIFKQTLAPSELIVIDDGSVDNSVRIIERTLRDCPFPCEFISRENRGLCRTLNEALSRTGGSYFAYLGSDDIWFSEFLARRISALEARPGAVLGYGHAYHIDEQNRIIDCTLDWAAYADGDARRMLLTTLAPLSPTVVYRRTALERHGWNEHARLEDYELYLRLSAEGEFAFDASVLAAWRQHGYNTSRDLLLMINERLAAQRRAAKLIGINEDELREVQALANFRSAEEFMRRGDKLTALRLLAKSGRGIPSLNALARLVAGLAAPHRAMLQRKERLRREAFTRYGSLSV